MWTCVEYRTADEQKCFVGKKNRIKTNNFYNGNCVTTEWNKINGKIVVKRNILSDKTEQMKS